MSGGSDFYFLTTDDYDGSEPAQPPSAAPKDETQIVAPSVAVAVEKEHQLQLETLLEQERKGGEEARAEAETLKRKVADLSQRIDRSDSEKEDLIAELVAANAKVARFEDTIKCLTAQLEAVKTDAANRKAEDAKIQATKGDEAKALANELQKTMAENNHLETQTKRLSESCTLALQQVEKEKAMTNQLTIQLEAEKKKGAELNDKLLLTGQQVATQAASLQDMKKQLEEMAKKLQTSSTATKAAQEWEGLLRKCEEEKAELRRRANETEMQLRATSNQLATARKEKNDATDEVLSLRAVMDEQGEHQAYMLARAEERAANGDLLLLALRDENAAELRRRDQELQMVQEQLKLSKTQREREIAQLKKDMQDTIQSLVAEATRLNAEIARLRSAATDTA